MAVTTFKYADQDDLRKVFPQAGQYHNKIRLIDFTETATSNLYNAYPGLMGTPGTFLLFFNGQEGAKVTSEPASAKQWRYTSDSDTLEVFHTADPNDAVVVEVGDDKDTFFNQILVDASMELSALLDGRYERPLPLSIQQHTGTGVTQEYDYLIIRMTCLLAAKNLLKAAGDHEEAQQYYSELYTDEGTGLIDRINKGDIKFSFEIDVTDKKGDVSEIVRAGTMYLAEVYGEYSGLLYDKIKILCTTGGAYGTAKVSIKSSDGTTLYLSLIHISEPTRPY